MGANESWPSLNLNLEQGFDRFLLTDLGFLLGNTFFTGEAFLSLILSNVSKTRIVERHLTSTLRSWILARFALLLKPTSGTFKMDQYAYLFAMNLQAMLLEQLYIQQLMRMVNPVVPAVPPEAPEAPQAPEAPVPEAASRAVELETPRRTAAMNSSFNSSTGGATSPRRSRRRYACPQCPATVSRKSLLKGHMTIHTGEKPFTCSFCPKTFADPSNKRVHEKTHSPDKPFQCEDCGKSFKLDRYLMKHKKNMHQRKRVVSKMNGPLAHVEARKRAKKNISQDTPSARD
uniref:C2H2-type domain-containing protein n=1 Tax=Steinernema glaseri TaxID=37863 RepID=A0A1I8AER4_9BILA